MISWALLFASLWSMGNCEWAMGNGQWAIVNCQWLIVNGQLAFSLIILER